MPFPYSKNYTNDYLIHDFSLSEIKLLKRKQRFEFRNQMMNDIFPYMTLNETIQLMQNMTDKMPRNRSNPNPTGLYIETKHYQYYLDHYGLNFAEILFEHLKAFSLETVEKSI